MSKVLLVGSSYSSAPIFNVLRKRGFHVSVCGAHPSDPCHEYADCSHFIDYSDSLALQGLIETEQYEFIVPSCNDTAYMSVVAATQSKPYPGFDTFKTANVLHAKHEFRGFTRQYEVPAPRWVDAGDAVGASSLRSPLLVKPVDAFSGRGVSKVEERSALSRAIDKAKASSQNGGVIVEEFVEGSLHSHSAFVVDGEIKQDFFVDEYCSVYPYQVDCSNHPSFLPSNIRNSVREAVDIIISKLGLCNGLLHTQFIRDDHQIWIIECMRRAPGDLFANLVMYSTGVNYTEMYTLPFIGENIVAKNSVEVVKNMARHTISVDKKKSLFSFSQSLPSSNVTVVPLKCSGHVISEAPYDKVAILFAEFEASDTLRQVTPSMAGYINIKTVEDSDAF